MAPRPRNIKILISYDGTGYSGWQRQTKEITIQGEIERSLKRMTREKITLQSAGRTDAGVHAEGMCAHFITHSTISCPDFLKGLNSLLTRSIRILKVGPVTMKFHSRFLAKGKLYQYSLYCGTIQPPQLRLYSLHITYPLNFKLIKECLKILEGTHDFSSFENSGSRDKNLHSGRGAIRTINKARLIEKSPADFILQFSGDGFLKNMIRNITGTLLEVGRGKITAREFGAILQAKDRTAAGPTAPAHGLCLMEVFY